jgi:hypothetical protein
MREDVTKSEFLEILRSSRTKWTACGGHNSIYLPEFDNTIRFRSMERPERLIGQNLAWFGVDVVEGVGASSGGWSRGHRQYRSAVSGADREPVRYLAPTD